MAWIQRGLDLNGEGLEDKSGKSVSISANGLVVAIGAPDNTNANGYYAGHVRVYAWDGSAWVQRGSDIDGEATDDAFGISVSLSLDGNVIAIGGSYNDGVNGVNSGHVRVYAWNGSTWNQRGYDIDGEAEYDFSGFATRLSSDGDVLVIGTADSDPNGFSSGSVRIFYWNGFSWVLLGSNIDGENEDDFAGSSVDISVTKQNSTFNPSTDTVIVAIGEKGNDGIVPESNVGRIRIFSWNGSTSTWDPRGSGIYGEAANDESGNVSLSANGNMVAIGTYANSGVNGSYSGHVRVYAWNGSTWNQRGADIDGEAAYDFSGINSISADGTILAIGSSNSNSGAGHVRVYAWNGSSWNQRGSDIDAQLSFGETIVKFGYSVSISADGNILAIGAPNKTTNAYEDGQVKIYVYSSAPDPPTGVSAVEGNGEATISFIPGSDGGSAITNYEVTSSPGSFTANGSSSPITMSGLTNGASYTFTVTATNNIGTSSPSEPSNSVTPTTPPDPPTNVVGISGNEQVAVSWNAPLNDGGEAIIGYKVSAYLNIDSTLVRTDDTESDMTEYIFASLTNGTEYKFTVQAYNGIGDSSESFFSSLVIPTSSNAVITPRPLVGGNFIKLWWDPPQFPGPAVTGYSITCPSPSFSNLFPSTSRFAFLTNLETATEYTFTITTKVGDLSVGSSTWAPVTTGIQPGSISNLQGTLNYPQGATITWTPTTSHGVKHQVVYAYAYNGSGNRVEASDVKQSYWSYTTQAYVYPFVDGYTYKIQVKAVNDAGYSLTSPEITIVNQP